MDPRNILFGSLMTLLAGCSLAPFYQRPAMPTATSYPGVNGAAAQANQGSDQLGWRDFFTDTRLRELIAQALENNRDLRIAMQRVSEARGLYGIQRADRLPDISAAATATRARVPAALSPTGRAVTANQFEATLNLSAWELDFWGRVRNLTTAALESYLATEEARSAVVISLIAQVATTYLFERELDERIDIARQTLTTRDDSSRIAKRRYEVGYASKLDAAQADALLNQARADLASLLSQRDQNYNALTLLVGIPVVTPENRPLSQIERDFVRVLAVGLPSDLLLNRPDIRAAEHRLKAANANIGAARAAFLPRIMLTGNLGTASIDLSLLFGGGSSLWSFSPSLTLPLFDGGRNRANLDVAKARSNLAVADYERTIQGAFREVADALAGRRWLTEQVIAQQATLAAQTERARLAGLRYQNGAAPYLEVLDAERDRFAAEQALVQVRRALLSSMVNLYAALGGGAVHTAQ
ncbi:MAG: efflux transporter outer membrane subunit [Desulfuromonadales bacterium]|nr:efflux transporter outer membrane subunit [Desulfuromonadales bacterium]